MSPRYIPVLLLAAAAAVFYACGPRSHAAEPESEPVATGPGFASSLDVTVRDRVGLALRVTNNGTRRLELTFPNGQTHDFVVLDSVGREVWRWSDGRLFTQPLLNDVLDESETVTYQASLPLPSTPGRYTAVAKLMSENHPMQRRVDFSVP